MSTQEREAMERLAQLDPSESNWREVYESDDPYDVSERQTTDQLAVITAALSRHARSLQPITVEGLVAMGFEDRRIDGVKAFYRLGVHAIVQDGELVFKDSDTFMPFLPQPLSLADVDNLIERLSR